MKDIAAMQVQMPSLLKIAEAAVRRAGAYLIQKLGSAEVVSHKASHDDLLDADLEAEHIILTALREEAPDLGVLSEEAGFQGNQEHYWIVDPLDGSANFQHGNPLFAIALALVINHLTVGSVIYLPMQDELFSALRYQGAFLNGKRIGVSQTSQLSETIAHLGDIAKGNDAAAISERLKDLTLLATRVQRLRMVGTAALDLAYLACGRADLLLNHATEPWDIEAGQLLLLEAGGKVTRKYYQSRSVSLYSNGLLHQAVEDLMAS